MSTINGEMADQERLLLMCHVQSVNMFRQDSSISAKPITTKLAENGVELYPTTIIKRKVIRKIVLHGHPATSTNNWTRTIFDKRWYKNTRPVQKTVIRILLGGFVLVFFVFET